MDLALFDFDGTITRGDTFTPFLRYAVPPWRIAVGSVVLAPLIAAYRAGFLPPATMRSCLVAAAFRGQLQADVQQLGERYARHVLPGVLREDAMVRLRWHKDRGDTVVVVSASLDAYLSGWCRAMGVDLICSELDVRAGILTGRYRAGDCTGKEKARRVLEIYDLRSYGVVFAYGDTGEDRDLLQLAHKKYYRGREL